MSNSYEEIIENLYSAFSCYPRPDKVMGSPISVEEGADKQLLSAPLRSVDIPDEYLFKAMSTWGTEDDFKYFLPRILELWFFSFGPYGSTVFFSKIFSSGWETWTDEQKQAFEAYLLAKWESATTGPYYCLFTIGELCEHLGLFIDNFSALAEAWGKKWVEDENEDVFEELVRYINHHWIEIFYEYKPHISFKYAILESSLRQRIEEAFFIYEKSRPDFAKILSACEHKLFTSESLN